MKKPQEELWNESFGKQHTFDENEICVNIFAVK